MKYGLRNHILSPYFPLSHHVHAFRRVELTLKMPSAIRRIAVAGQNSSAYTAHTKTSLMGITFSAGIPLYLVAAKVLSCGLIAVQPAAIPPHPALPGKTTPQPEVVPRRTLPPTMPPEQIDEFLGLFNSNTTLPETLLMDQSGVKITATGLPYTAYSVDLQLTIENNSGNALTMGNTYFSLGQRPYDQLLILQPEVGRRTVRSYRDQTMGVFTGG